MDQVDIFSKMDQYERVKLLNMLNVKVLSKGEYVFLEGEPGDNFYMIQEGVVECVKMQKPAQLGESAVEMHVRDLGAGEHFGELALLNPDGGGKRSLSVRVKSEHCKLVFVDRIDF